MSAIGYSRLWVSIWWALVLLPFVFEIVSLFDRNPRTPLFTDVVTKDTPPLLAWLIVATLQILVIHFASRLRGHAVL